MCLCVHCIDTMYCHVTSEPFDFDSTIVIHFTSCVPYPVPSLSMMAGWWRGVTLTTAQWWMTKTSGEEIHVMLWISYYVYNYDCIECPFLHRLSLPLFPSLPLPCSSLKHTYAPSPPSSTSWCRWWDQSVSVLDYAEPVTIKADLTCNDAIRIFSENSMQQMPVVGKDG